MGEGCGFWRGWMSAEMSWRPTATLRTQGERQLSLLPQFEVPAHVHDFALENRPPALPQRTGPLRALSLCVTGMLCMVGALALMGVAAEPASRHGQIIAQNMRSVVGEAISHANEAAEARSRMHEAARAEYMQRRGLAAEPQPPVGRPAPSSLLLRLASIRKAEASAIDDELVAQLFPRWKTEGEWNQSEVLKDLILAVSHLAYRSETPGR